MPASTYGVMYFVGEEYRETPRFSAKSFAVDELSGVYLDYAVGVCATSFYNVRLEFNPGQPAYRVYVAKSPDDKLAVWSPSLDLKAASEVLGNDRVAGLTDARECIPYLRELVKEYFGDYFEGPVRSPA